MTSIEKKNNGQWKAGESGNPKGAIVDQEKFHSLLQNQVKKNQILIY